MSNKVDTITVRWLFLLWLLISAAVTYFSMSNLEHFVVVDHQILNDPNFREADRYWKQKKKSTISYSGSSINIDNTVVSSEVIAQHINISGPVFVRLSVEVGSEAIFPNEKPWSGGSVAIIYYGKDRTARLGQNTLVTLKRAGPIRSYSKVLYLNKNVESIDVTLRLLNAKGQFSARNPKLSILAELPNYVTVKMLLVYYWCFVAFSFLILLYKIFPIRFFVGIGSLSVVAIVGIILPGEIITGFNQSLFNQLPEGLAVIVQRLSVIVLGSFDSTAPSAGISKLGHFLVFFLIGVLVGKAFRRLGLIYGVALLAVLAIVTEALQLLVFGRSTLLHDVYIDLSGGILGLLFGIGSLLLLEKHRRKCKPT